MEHLVELRAQKKIMIRLMMNHLDRLRALFSPVANVYREIDGDGVAVDADDGEEAKKCINCFYEFIFCAHEPTV